MKYEHNPNCLANTYIITDVVRKPSNPALVAAIEEIAEEEYLLEAEEKVEVDIPENMPDSFDQPPNGGQHMDYHMDYEPPVGFNVSESFELPIDSGVDTLADSKPAEHVAGN